MATGAGPFEVGARAEAVRSTGSIFSTWRTITTPHFVLNTDVSEIKILSLLTDLTRVREGLSRVLNVDPGPLEIDLHGNEQEFIGRYGLNNGLYVQRGTPARDVFVSYDLRETSLLDEILAQAIARQLVTSKHPVLPGWLVDGLVDHLGSVQLGSDRLDYGGPPRVLALDKQGTDVAPLSELIASDMPGGLEIPARTIRATAWALVGYLMDAEIWGPNAQDRFLAWLALVARAQKRPTDVVRALNDLYPERSMSDLDAEIASHASLRARIRKFPHTVAVSGAAEVTARVRSSHLPDDPRLRSTSNSTSGPSAASTTVFGSPAPRWRHQFRLDFEFLAPKESVGFTYGLGLLPRHALDLELGFGPFGYFASPRYRFTILRLHRLFVDVGVGLFHAVKSESLGLTAEPLAPDERALSDATSFRHTAALGEIAIGIHVAKGAFLRIATTVLARVATDFTRFCADPRYRKNDACRKDSYFPPVSGLAQESQVIMLRGGIGYAF